MRLVTLMLVVPALAACQGYAARPAKLAVAALADTAPADYERPCATAPSTPLEARECDRRSILAMAGEFRVRFAFDETAALAPGYAPQGAQRSGGTELVEVVADTGDLISLQHILVVGREHHVIKHWRQDWRFQPASVLRYVGAGRFEAQPVSPADAAGAWSQTVFEVDDAPRYAGIGRWTHADGVDAWQSDATLRPLPRREYTKRHDYAALRVTNRHTLTPAGWVHEQDNTKLAPTDTGGFHAVARERGLNSYVRIHDYDFTAGRDYWRRTRGYWAAVRAEWERYASAHPRFVTSPEPHAAPRIEAFFALAERAGGGADVPASEVQALVERYAADDAAPVAAAGAAAATRKESAEK